MMGGAGDIKLYEKLKKFKNEVQKISFSASKRIFVFRGYKDEFAYALQLATDFYLMPSRFEPCGLTQMEAMAKGSLPITTSTGGLVDTIENGEMTKDLALITTIENPKVLNTADFIKAVRKRLETI